VNVCARRPHWNRSAQPGFTEQLNGFAIVGQSRETNCPSRIVRDPCPEPAPLLLPPRRTLGQTTPSLGTSAIPTRPGGDVAWGRPEALPDLRWRVGREIAQLSYVHQQQTREEKRWKCQKIRKHLTELEGLLRREIAR
jgi:hypothetical protein